MRWRYEVRESEIELQHGLFIVKTNINSDGACSTCRYFSRSNFRKYNLAGITISTAATNHMIPALITEEADEIKRPNFRACKGGGRRCLIHDINYIGLLP